MIIEPVESERTNEQFITADVPFYVCGWLNGDTELRSLTYEDEPIHPPNKVSSFKEVSNLQQMIPQYGLGLEILEGYERQYNEELNKYEWILVDAEKRKIYWDQFVYEIEENRGKTIPPKED